MVSGLCLKDQRSLLLQLKSDYHLSADSRKLVTWSESIGCCEWSGVTCDDEGHVLGLDLSGESLVGGFDNSSTIFSLKHLQYLNLASNEFNSEIPSGFNKLENLTYLNLSKAGFIGQVPSEEISQMTRLVTLDISTHSELSITNLGNLVKNLVNIKQLYLDDVNISARGEEWNSAMLQIPTLQELSMSGCQLSGPLESSLTRLENISLLCLDWNNFSSPVPETFANFKNLTTLSLVACGLTGMFPQKIFQVPTLTLIDISYNDYLNGFFPDFSLNAYLQDLIVTSTNFSGPLPNSIGNLRNLTTLDLSSSQFNGTVPNVLSNLTQLVELDLSGNSFGGSIPSLTLCKKLDRVSLGGNHFTGEIPTTHFAGLANLAELSLKDNFFTGVFPFSIFMLPSLETKQLSKNEFSGKLNEFRNVSSSIQELDLSNNHLEGHIPMSIFQLSTLVQLDLSFNKFNGTLDLHMVNKLGNLDRLDLSNNNLSLIDITTSKSNSLLFPIVTSVNLASCNLTTFPQFLKNQSSLYELDLSNNHIAGMIPKWIWNQKSLKFLNLSHNYLTNWVEPLLINCSNLKLVDLHSNQLQGPLQALPPFVFYLDYSNNNLSSFIPPNIGSLLSMIEYLYFSSNNLNGTIPESICNASLLSVLDLSNNVLTGAIPKCLIPMLGTLTVLDLSRNKLNGTIDTLFHGTCELRTLNLNGNSLQGKVPKYLANCTNLEVLDLGNNKILDNFPCLLKSIATLSVLILRSNNLHGPLKCPVTWPSIQIIDLASNNFSGRVPNSFFETWKAMMKQGNLSKADYLQFKKPGFKVYQDSVTVISKNQEMQLVRILTIFTSVDLSCNKFEGLVPEEFGQLKALYILNLSHNAFSSHIPSSLGNLKNLESLDLSNNKLTGEIPTQLASISFLEFLNLSNNHLEGRIPTGTQIQSFEAASFKGNDGLCGPPLTLNCNSDSPPASSSNVDNEKSSIDWNFISVELGITFGIGTIILPILFCKSWRIWYWERVDNLLYRIFPQLDWVYEYHGGQGYRTLRWMRN
ncbi:hypothetical protein RIF29_40138 [Crotalaria pallida]|uniref:Leucine-rich repeat-containing N-terminal plant-type domain-containing protein n=1 Tax=Crotalaria pallida TaxID=3830 RepID=A0AAN9E2K9_CROPI